MPKPLFRQGQRASSSRVVRTQGKKAGSANILAGARNVQISGGNFSIVQGGVHNHAGGGNDLAALVWAALQAVPNFRQIYQDMLAKATPGTGMWLLRNDRFRVWLDPNGNIKIFWGSGMPGAGKTVLASIVIQQLEAFREESDGQVCICYVYFRYSDHAELTLRAILETFIKQTLERHPDHVAIVNKIYTQHIREGTQPTEAQLLGVLRQLNENMTATFYILDALDEAPPRIQLAVLKALSSLDVKVFVTSRPLKSVEAAFPNASTFTIKAEEQDIELHIAERIRENADLQNLLRQEGQPLWEEIVSTVKRKSGGMFLHASLQMDALQRECVTVHSIRQILDSFPSEIEDVYHQTWNRILKQSQDAVSLVKAALIWVLNASRSLTIEELVWGVATFSRTHKFEHDRVIPGTTLLGLCCGLLLMEEESGLVRLVHYTAKDPLQKFLYESFPHPPSTLTTVCINHLIECGLQNTTIGSEEEFLAAFDDDPLLGYASEAWAFHARQSFDLDNGIKERTARFVAGSKAFPAFISFGRRFFFDILTPLHIVAHYHLPIDFIEDLDTCNPNVTTKICQQSPLIIASASGYTDLVKLLSSRPDIQVNMVDNSGSSALMLGARYGHEANVSLLLAHPKVQVNLVDRSGWSALMRAINIGSEGIVVLLLARPDIEVNLVDNSGWSALMLATKHEDGRIVAPLLARPDLKVNLVKNDGLSALMLAARNGHEGVVTLLLTRPDTDVNLVDQNGWSALLLALTHAREAIATLLLNRPELQVNATQRDGLSALMLAAIYNCESVLTLLLTLPGIQVNLVENNGWSALMLAASHGFERVVGLLLGHPAIQVNLVKSDGLSALMVAASKGYERIAGLLLTHPNILINLVDKKGWSALMRAANIGSKGVVKLLVDRPDTQVNLTDSSGWSALLLGTKHEDEGIATLLLDHPEIQVNLAKKDGWSALMMAVIHHHERLATALLAYADIQVNLVKNDGWSALMLAATNGYQRIVTLLLAHPDIQVNLVDSHGWSALMMATSKGHEHIVGLLLTVEGIDVNCTSQVGHTAIKLASGEGYESIVRLLLSIPSIDVSIKCVEDGHTAMSAALAKGHTGIASLLREFEAQSSVPLKGPSDAGELSS